jgi:phosphonopyruvate decarboxylase
MTSTRTRIDLREALEPVRSARGEGDIVITTMGAAREWMAMGAGPLDFIFVPSSMSQATSLGLGLALAQPGRRVIVCNGDGSMLMNLGSLVTITAEAPPNLLVIVFDNGVYEVTGAQPTPGSSPARASAQSVDFAGMARACGFTSVQRFDYIDAWRGAVSDLLGTPGPHFVVLDIAPIPGAPGPRSPGPAGERAQAFMAALRR